MNHLFPILTALAYLVSFGLYVRFLGTGNKLTGRLGTLLLGLGLIVHYFALLERSRGLHTVPYHDLYGSMSLFGWLRAFIRSEPHFSWGGATAAKPQTRRCGLAPSATRVTGSNEPIERTSGSYFDRHWNGIGFRIRGPAAGAEFILRPQIHDHAAGARSVCAVLPSGGYYGVAGGAGFQTVHFQFCDSGVEFYGRKSISVA